MNRNPSTFHYSSLEKGRGFRILNLLPSKDKDDEIVCTLTMADLDEYPPFEALSYVWGQEWSERPLMLEGCAVKITSNLECVLRDLRRRDEPRRLWVDALCIDQSNLDERRVHVQYMKDIYERCERDLLWLGSDEETLVNASTAFKTFKTAVNALKLDDKAAKLSRTEVRELLKIFVKGLAWHRVWVMQEVAFAPQVVLVAGQAEVPWQELEDFLEVNDLVVKYGIPDAFHAPHGHDYDAREMLNELLAFPQILAQQRMVTKTKDGGNLSSLMDVLARFRFTKATDPRDKIYALLGLARDRLGLEADYTRHVREVYIDCSKRLMEHDGNLDLICQGPWQMSDNEDRVKGLPSWVPDYSAPGDSRIMFAQRGIYNAGGVMEVKSLNISQDGNLILDGLSLGALVIVRNNSPHKPYPAIGPADPEGFTLSGLSREILSWMPDSLLKILVTEDNVWLSRFLSHDNEPERVLAPEKAFEDYWRTLTLDCGRFPVHRLSESEISSLGLTFNSLIRETRIRDERSPADKEVFKLLNPRFHKWTFAVSNEGLYCMAPPYAQADDCIAVVPGAKVPLLFRPTGEVPETYTYLGPCYVHGFMDGQIYKLPDGGLRKRRFEIA